MQAQGARVIAIANSGDEEVAGLVSDCVFVEPAPSTCCPSRKSCRCNFSLTSWRWPTAWTWTSPEKPLQSSRERKSQVGENVHVGQDLVAMFGTLNTGDGVTVDGDRVVQPAWLFYAPTIFLVVVIVLIVREFRAYRRRAFLRGYGFPPRP
jgi:hypothetical protein